jgi:hypothetical protein
MPFQNLKKQDRSDRWRSERVTKSVRAGTGSSGNLAGAENQQRPGSWFRNGIAINCE